MHLEQEVTLPARLVRAARTSPSSPKASSLQVREQWKDVECLLRMHLTHVLRTAFVPTQPLGRGRTPSTLHRLVDNLIQEPQCVAVILLYFLALMSGCLAQCGCATVDRAAGGLHVPPDRNPRSATLRRVTPAESHHPPRRRLIGLTHAHHSGEPIRGVFCGGDAFHRSIEGGIALEVLALDADVILFDYPGTATPRNTYSSAILDTALAVYDYASAL